MPSRSALVDEEGRVGDVRAQPLRVALVARRRPRRARSGSTLVDALEPDVLLGERDLDLLAEDLRVEEVLDADPDARRLVGVRGPIPRRVVPIWSLPSRRSVAWSIAMCHGMIRCALPESVSRSVGCRAPRDRRARRSAPPGRRRSRRRSRRPCRARIPRRQLAELERLAAGDDRVPGVRPALVAADEVRVAARAGRRSCPCPRRPTAHRRSRSQARRGVCPNRPSGYADGRAGSRARRAISWPRTQVTAAARDRARRPLPATWRAEDSR